MGDILKTLLGKRPSIPSLNPIGITASVLKGKGISTEHFTR